MPGEDVRDDVVDPVRSQALPVEGDDLRRAVDRGDAAGDRNQAMRPEPRSTGELERLAPRTGLAQRGLDGSDLREPFGAVRGAPVVAAGSQEPFVVLAGARPVVGQLLVEELLVVHNS